MDIKCCYSIATCSEHLARRSASTRDLRGGATRQTSPTTSRRVAQATLHATRCPVIKDIIVDTRTTSDGTRSSSMISRGFTRQRILLMMSLPCPVFAAGCLYQFLKRVCSGRSPYPPCLPPSSIHIFSMIMPYCV